MGDVREFIRVFVMRPTTWCVGKVQGLGCFRFHVLLSFMLSISFFHLHIFSPCSSALQSPSYLALHIPSLCHLPMALPLVLVWTSSIFRNPTPALSVSFHRIVLVAWPLSQMVFGSPVFLCSYHISCLKVKPSNHSPWICSTNSQGP